MLQTTTLCNASCSFCPYPQMTYPKEEMAESLFQKIIAECRNEYSHIDTIIPYLMNEPLCDSRITDKIWRIKEQVPETGCHILTNGSLLNDKTADKIIHSPIDWVGISVFGITSSGYEKAMGLSFKKVKPLIDKFVRKALLIRGSDFIEITFFLWGDINKKDAELAKDYWQELGVKRFSISESGISRAGNIRDIKSPSHKAVKNCSSIWTNESIHILSNGDIVPCCMDWQRTTILGNIQENSIRDIWNSAEYNSFRIKQRSGNSDKLICLKCEMAETK